MNHLHYEFELEPGDLVRVRLDNQTNVRLLDEGNYRKYRSGQQHRYHGGLAETSPVTIAAPSKGRWHLVIDLGGYPGTVRASAERIPAAQAVSQRRSSKASFTN